MVNTGLNIRRAIPADVQLLSDLSGTTFFETFKNTCTDEDLAGFIDTSYNADQILNELKDVNDLFFLAFIDMKPVGYLKLTDGESEIPVIKAHKSLEISRLYVLKEYHSQKVGAALMEFALKYGTKNNYEVLWLGVWEHNERAKSFYDKFGFKDTGFSHSFPIGNTPQTDIWLMRFI
jgi:ribosomal protein S18 acetylase RimI-like enzyme